MLTRQTLYEILSRLGNIVYQILGSRCKSCLRAPIFTHWLNKEGIQFPVAVLNVPYHSFANLRIGLLSFSHSSSSEARLVLKVCHDAPCFEWGYFEKFAPSYQTVRCWLGQKEWLVAHLRRRKDGHFGRSLEIKKDSALKECGNVVLLWVGNDKEVQTCYSPCWYSVTWPWCTWSTVLYLQYLSQKTFGHLAFLNAHK